MKPVQNYSAEAVERLKHWIAEMNSNGDTKFYEIFVDGMRIVSKTNDVEEFDRHKVWVGVETQQIKVLTYNTFGSHRSKPFEFRTQKYPQEINYKEIVQALEIRNEGLSRRLEDAERYIKKLEMSSIQPSSGGFDLETIIASLGKISQQFPGLKDSLGGLGSMFNTATSVQSETSENCKASFRRKPSSEDPVQGEGAVNHDHPEIKKNSNHILTTNVSLDMEHERKMIDVAQFFAENPAYVDVVYELVKQEKGRIKDNSTD